MSLIVISREMGSGGTLLGRAVAERLGYRFAGREVILEAVKRYRVPEESLSQLEEGKPRFWERLDRERLPRLPPGRDLRLRRGRRRGDRRPGGAVPLPTASITRLRVRVTAPVAVRASRLAEEAKIPLERGRGADRPLRQRFGGSPRAALQRRVQRERTCYDVVLNTERGTSDGHAGRHRRVRPPSAVPLDSRVGPGDAGPSDRGTGSRHLLADLGPRHAVDPGALGGRPRLARGHGLRTRVGGAGDRRRELGARRPARGLQLDRSGRAATSRLAEPSSARGDRPRIVSVPRPCRRGSGRGER